MDILEKERPAGDLNPKKKKNKKKKKSQDSVLPTEVRTTDAQSSPPGKKKNKNKLFNGGEKQQPVPSDTGRNREVIGAKPQLQKTAQTSNVEGNAQTNVEKSPKRKKSRKASVADPIGQIPSVPDPEIKKSPKKRQLEHLEPVQQVPEKPLSVGSPFQTATPTIRLKEKSTKATSKDKLEKLKTQSVVSYTPKAAKSKKGSHNFKQATLHETLLGGGTLHEALLARGLVSAEKKLKTKKNPKAEPSTSHSSVRNKIDKKKKKKEKTEQLKPVKITKAKKDEKSEAKAKSKKNKKMDVVEKAGNNPKLFGQTIDISDNSTDSAELKIATNEEDTSELSSEYDSSDSDHIMKSIKSFNKKGASKTAVKKGDEPPPPKPKPKIYSSSEDEESKEDDDDDEEIEDEEKDAMEVMEDDSEEPPAKPDADDVFLDGWTKADVQELLSRMRKEIPKNDFIKAATRLNQMNWENIKFGSHSSGQCQEKWKAIEKKIRGYRILEELICDAEHWLEQPWTDFRKGGKNKNKIQKHPEMPKKPLTTYMLFYMRKKDKIAKEFPGLSLTDLSKVIAERFNKLPPHKKSKYHTMHLEMKEEYASKMAKFAEAHPTEMARVYGNGSRQKKRAVNMPGWSGGEKPTPPVKLYLSERMKRHSNDTNYGELLATYKEKWKHLSPKKKLPFIILAHNQETKYLEDLKAYHSLNPNVDIPKYKPVLSKEERNILAKTQGKPDKPPTSAYLLFSKTMLRNPQIKGSTPKERMQEVAKLWKDVPDQEKELYKKKVSELHANYKLEYGSYLASLTEEQRKEEEEEQKGKSKRKGKDSDEVAPPTKKSRAVSKVKQPKLEDIVKREPNPPPADIFDLFTRDIKKQFPNKNYPAKEIKKSFDALLEEPRAELKERLEKLKTAYLEDYKRFCKSLPEDELKLYLDNKTPFKQNLKLSESEGSEDEDESEDEEVEAVEVEEDVRKKNGETKPEKTTKTAVKSANSKSLPKNESSDDSDDEDEDEEKKNDKSSSSSSSESSSDEESSSSSSSSSSSGEDEAGQDAAAF